MYVCIIMQATVKKYYATRSTTVVWPCYDYNNKLACCHCHCLGIEKKAEPETESETESEG